MNDWQEAYFEYGVDLRNRRVFLGDIDMASCADTVKSLYFLDTISDKPIELFICSYGGEVEACLGIYDVISTLNAPLHTFAYGVCQSAAPLLLASGEPGNRWVAPNLRLMTHECSGGSEGRTREMQANLKYITRLEETWYEIVAKHTGKLPRFWRRLSNKPHDYFFSADEAIEWGLADQMWVQK